MGKKKDGEKANLSPGKCISALRVTRYASRRNFDFHGSWLVNYDPREYKYPEILLDLAQIQDHFIEKGINFNSINIKFNKNSHINYFFQENNTVLLSFCNINAGFEKKDIKSIEKAIFNPLEKAIKTITLLFPRLENDPRWKTMGLPAGQMFLATSLSANGFEPKALPMVLPGENPPPEALSGDLAGITLFEDLLPFLRPFLAVFRASYGGILAAGGPFPTLSPLAAAFHLPQINLWVRGEAELALPGILQALNQGDAGAFFANQGALWQQPGVIAMAGFDKVNRPGDLRALGVKLDFLRPAQLEKGLEINFSRGCRRGCVFCCRVQGGKFRKLPLDKAEELIGSYASRLDPAHPPGTAAWTVNINDDDILQDPDYAREIFALVRGKGLHIFGVQTSTASLVGNRGIAKTEILDLVSDPGLYVEDRPLLWLGTDTFLPERARRLGKKLPSIAQFTQLLGEFEKRGLRHFHYWISSDGDSTWEEFVDELTLIFVYFRDFPNFGLLAHAPFIVPYPSSRLFSTLELDDPRLKVKLVLEAPDDRFSYQVVDHLETRWPQLNNLLKNEKAGGESGFFDFLKDKNLMAAAQIVYYFLKQEQLQGTTTNSGLLRAREDLEKVISELMQLRDA